MPNILIRNLTEANKKALAIMAKHNKRSFNNEVLVAIDKYLEDDKNCSIIKEK